ncbi:MAG: hypothetical protein RML94_08050 [Bacteroidia bacterium]|nr:hypothetical protein [Bacteroidia bacterium]
MNRSFVSGRVPSLRSGRRAAGCAIASVLRTAYAPFACLTQQRFNTLPCLHAYVCFTLFDAHFQVFARLNLEHISCIYLFNPEYSSFTLL